MFRFLVLFAALILGAPAYAQSPMQPCQDQFYQGAIPTVAANAPINVASGKQFFLCYSEFGVLNSNITKTPIWSAERLTPERVTAAKLLQRKNKFHSEKLIPSSDEAKLSDYLGSHYDRGHMSPDDDMGDMQAQFQSFSLANMIPQSPCNNEIIWKAIETSVRTYVLAHGDVYVVTGPIFDDNKTIGLDDVRVPSRIFKAIYDPRLNSMTIMVVPNANVQSYTTATPDQLKTWTGITPFPAASNAAMSLTIPPLPNFSGSCAKEG